VKITHHITFYSLHSPKLRIKSIKIVSNNSAVSINQIDSIDIEEFKMTPFLLLDGHLLQIGRFSFPIHPFLNIGVFYLPALFDIPSLVTGRTQSIRVLQLF